MFVDIYIGLFSISPIYYNIAQSKCQYQYKIEDKYSLVILSTMA